MEPGSVVAQTLQGGTRFPDEHAPILLTPGVAIAYDGDMPDPRHDRARELRAQGWSKPAIARELGVSPSTIKTWLPAERPRPVQRVERADLVRMRNELHLTNSEIARRTHISRQRVAQILGPVPRLIEGERRSVTIQLPVNDLERLREMAQHLGYLSWAGTLSGQGSVSALVAGIAEGQLELRPRRKRR